MEKHIRVIGKILEEMAKKYGDKTFLYFRDEQVSYRELNAASNRVSNGFLKLGIKKGDNVSIMLPNCPDFLYSWFGLAKIGAVNVPVNNMYKGEFLRYIIDHSDSKIIIIHNQFLERLKLLEKDLPKLEKVILFGGASQVEVGFTIIPFEELIKSPDTSPKIEVGQYDLDAIIYTSGTTGPPKGVMRTHGYSCNAAAYDIQTRGTSSDDILYTCLPLFHQNAQLATALPGLMAGASIALAERFSASRFWDDIRKYKATQFNLIGAMLNYLYKQPPKENDADQPARLAVGGPFSKSIFNEFRQRFNIKFLEGYGLTESGLLTVNPYDESNPKLGSFGKPTVEFDVRIVDDDDNEVPPGTVGEIVSRPKVPNVMMSGYYKMPEKTLEVFRNLWFHTGDYGKMDPDGYFYFIDRKKDYLRVGGENISSMQVETTINSHPKIAESAVLGIKLEEGAEDNMALYMVLKPGEKLTPEELMDWCQERLPRFAVPRFVEFLDELPKTPTERVEKYKLKERGVGPNTWDRVKVGYKVKR